MFSSPDEPLRPPAVANEGSDDMPCEGATQTEERYRSQLETSGVPMQGSAGAGQLSLEDILFRLGDVIDRAVDLTAPRAFAKGVAFRVDESAQLPARCNGDALCVSQILVNLLSNAVKFTEQGAVALGVSREGDTLTFRVADSGIGIGPGQMGSLFVPFHQADGSTTRRFGGTGLGLTISRRLARMMGGNIEVASRLGDSSVLLLRLPLRGAGPAAPSTDTRVGLAGLEAREARQLAGVLQARGMEVELVQPALALATSGEVLVLDSEALSNPRLETAARAALEGGRILGFLDEQLSARVSQVWAGASLA
jgi:hypothetical protein